MTDSMIAGTRVYVLTRNGAPFAGDDGAWVRFESHGVARFAVWLYALLDRSASWGLRPAMARSWLELES